MDSNYRVELVVVNTTNAPLQCTNTCCEGFDVPGFELSIGTQVQPGQSATFRSETHNRLFATFQPLGGSSAWEMAMTCPRGSHNSACGNPGAGLQTYSRSGTPATFRFIPGQANKADWNHGDRDDGDVVKYGNCR